jgi:hypothetical protein
MWTRIIILNIAAKTDLKCIQELFVGYVISTAVLIRCIVWTEFQCTEVSKMRENGDMNDDNSDSREVVV